MSLNPEYRALSLKRGPPYCFSGYPGESVSRARGRIVIPFVRELLPLTPPDQCSTLSQVRLGYLPGSGNPPTFRERHLDPELHWQFLLLLIPMPHQPISEVDSSPTSMSEISSDHASSISFLVPRICQGRAGASYRDRPDYHDALPPGDSS